MRGGWSQLVGTLERVGQVHNFSKGMGLAAPQISIGRAAAVVRTVTGETVTLLNPRVCDESADTDEQYEGCLSFFDVRGMVPRPLAIEVETPGHRRDHPDHHVRTRTGAAGPSRD